MTKSKLIVWPLLFVFAVAIAACSGESNDVATEQDDNTSAAEVLGEIEASPDITSTTNAETTTSEAPEDPTTTTAATTTAPPPTTAATTTTTAQPTTTAQTSTTSQTSTTEAATTTTTVAATATEAPTTTAEAPATTEAATTTESTTTAAAPPVDGGAIYAQRCAGCHGGNGAGVRGPNIQTFDDRGAGIARVTNGGNGMPSFSGTLSPEEIAAVVDFVINNL